MPNLRVTFSGLCVFVFDKPIKTSGPDPSRGVVLLQKLTQCRLLTNATNGRREVLDPHYPLLEFPLRSWSPNESSAEPGIVTLHGPEATGIRLLAGSRVRILPDEVRESSLVARSPQPTDQEQPQGENLETLWWIPTLDDAFPGSREIAPRFIDVDPGPNEPILACVELNRGTLKTTRITDLPARFQKPAAPGFSRRVAVQVALEVPFKTSVQLALDELVAGQRATKTLTFSSPGDISLSIRNMEIDSVLGLSRPLGLRAEADFEVYSDLLQPSNGSQRTNSLVFVGVGGGAGTQGQGVCPPTASASSRLAAPQEAAETENAVLKEPTKLDLSLEQPVDPSDSLYQPILQNLQGNILQPCRRQNVALLLIHFTANPIEIRTWLRTCAKELLPSAADEADPKALKREIFAGLYLSSAGYVALGFSAAEVVRRFDDRERRVRFSGGMKDAAGRLGDPSPETWEKPFGTKAKLPVHAALYLAADDRRALLGKCNATTKELGNQKLGQVLRVQEGAVIRKPKASFEHFGFADNLSQPLFLQGDLGRKSRSTWDPIAPLDLVLVPDPFVADGRSFGSFLVYRKLEQDMKGFETQIQKLAAATHGDEKLARAQVIGRFQDGTPVALSSCPAGKPNRNDFDYTGDLFGERCPFHAHIRKVNPRTEDSRHRRIVRRGVPYEEKSGRNGTKKGLLFLCFQADIEKQFVFLQEAWANDESFPKTGAGIDPVVGQNGHSPSPQVWPKSWGSDARVPFDFRCSVTLKGGEFFFAPSLSFLKGL